MGLVRAGLERRNRNPMRLTVVNPTSRKGREKWGTHRGVAFGEKQVPPVSLRSRVGMTGGWCGLVRRAESKSYAGAGGGSHLRLRSSLARLGEHAGVWKTSSFERTIASPIIGTWKLGVR